MQSGEGARKIDRCFEKEKKRRIGMRKSVRKREKEEQKRKMNARTPLPTNIVLPPLPLPLPVPIPFPPHEIQHRHELDAADPREAEGQEDEVQIFLQFDHGARVVGVDGDVWPFYFFQFFNFHLYALSSSRRGRFG